ncbi:phosphonate ABC transporter ATP-binding protein [Halalkalibacterium halodurans]|jgi:phosphonate transport system ATP-binding protein|uniref:Phosphonates import ATP-binding protein PhnC 1 n=2 Tax=Halalkalibacterium halodurans TaxID=86665 RepID=PHNC1_HALH5|nr:phosphonate ABC transporter ATP-binding protein [Halalkalibacterium halodurans]Q9KFN9.1 RecName: Full=Phosphonates import ATP-binding protein PhnC 1 [Halalkalibacterium halodurans C-125]MDY7220941.1 phosphonate ABC transporter ATP-binding protein [Halalkalibacterium halodurans]MDY7240180.1 phosphonate ABC transporter ATP-binding protein [Halalkalibacterium halodurans]MED4122816.1 phosphonate ABC transporter ATP-binding protein [Halalkalibacterium halodurans]MED4174444.1 phosphonate ABC tran
MIELKNVSKVYPNGVIGLDNINLTIEKGEFVAIVGLSGAGKSTLLRAMNRLIDISDGDIMINRRSITSASGKELRMMRRDIGMIFQNFNLVKRSTVLRNVLSGRVAHNHTFRTLFNLFPQKDVDLALQSLERVNILEKAYTRSSQLSGGQQQRVSIARALAQEAKMILADEPTASLDPVTTKQVMDDLKKINTEDQVTVVINLHFVDLAREYATRIIGLRDGKVVFDGPAQRATDEVFKDIYGRPLKEDELLGKEVG